MKKFLILIFLFNFSFATKSFSQESCSVMAENIKELKKKVSSCWVDSDCKTYNYGCPFEIAPCIADYISTSEKDTFAILLEKIAIYRNSCETSCKNFKTDHCPQNNKRLLCINGYCKSMTESMMQPVPEKQ